MSGTGFKLIYHPRRHFKFQLINFVTYVQLDLARFAYLKFVWKFVRRIMDVQVRKIGMYREKHKFYLKYNFIT